MIRVDRWVWTYAGACLFGIAIGGALHGLIRSRAVADLSELEVIEPDLSDRTPRTEARIEPEDSVEPIEAAEPIDLGDRQGVRAWYRINPMQLRTRFLSLSLEEKTRLVDILGADAVSADPEFVLSQVPFLPKENQREVIKYAYQEWLDNDTPAAVDALIASHLTDEEIAAAMNDSNGDPESLARLVEARPGILSDPELQERLVYQCYPLALAGELDVLRSYPQMENTIRTVEMMVKPEKFGEALLEQPELASQLNLKSLFRSLMRYQTSDSDGFASLVTSLPTVELQQVAIDAAFSAYQGYPRVLYEYYESISGSEVAEINRERFRERIEVYSPELATKLEEVNP